MGLDTLNSSDEVRDSFHFEKNASFHPSCDDQGFFRRKLVKMDPGESIHFATMRRAENRTCWSYQKLIDAFSQIDRHQSVRCLFNVPPLWLRLIAVGKEEDILTSSNLFSYNTPRTLDNPFIYSHVKPDFRLKVNVIAPCDGWTVSNSFDPFSIDNSSTCHRMG